MTGDNQDPGRITRLRAHGVLLTSVACGLLLIGLTAVTVIDVIGRYIFNAPLSGASEMTELLLLGIIFLGLPAITLDNGHIAIDLVTEQMPQKIRAVLGMLAQVLSAGFFGVLSWQLWEHAGRLAAYQDTTVFLRIPLAPFCTAAACLMLLCALIICGRIIHPVFARRSGVLRK